MDGAKQKISVTLDAELLNQLRQRPGSVSAQLNEALRTEIQRRDQQAALDRLLEDLEATDGPLDTPEDIEAMARMEQVWRDLDASAAAEVDRRAS